MGECHNGLKDGKNMRFFRLCLFGIGVLLMVSPALRADTLNLSVCANITTPGAHCANQDSTKTQLTFNDGVITIVATGYNNGGSPTATDLYVKQGGANETGLGINGEIDNEINTAEFINLDLTDLVNKGIFSVILNLQSLQAGEGYEVCKGNTVGALGGSCVTGGNGSLSANVPVSFTSTTKILGITAFDFVGGNPNADILLDTVTTAPEPGVLTLFGSGLLCLGGLIRRNRKNLL